MCVLSSAAMVMPQPVVPAVDPSQLAAQQQAFINQQAMLMVSEGPQELGKSHIGVCAWRGSPALLCLALLSVTLGSRAGLSSVLIPTVKWALFKAAKLGTLFLPLCVHGDTEAPSLSEEQRQEQA